MSTPGEGTHHTPLDIEAQAAQLQDRVDRLPNRHYDPEEAYVTTNDNGLGRVLDEAYLATPSTSGSELRVGLMVGNSAIFSIAPELVDPARANLDMLVVVDRNGFMMDWLDYTKEVLDTSATPDEYRENIWGSEDPTCQTVQRSLLPALEGKIAMRGWLLQESQIMGPKHFLRSQERFDQCKTALASLVQVEAIVDLTDTDDMAALQSSLATMNAVIPWANMTNVYEHTGNDIDNTLSSLPFADEAAIVYSAHARQKQLAPGYTFLNQRRC